MGNALFLYIIYNVLTQTVQRANQHLVLQYASKCEVKQNESCCRKCCCPMGTVEIHSRLEQIEADDAIGYVPEHQQYHAESGHSHLQGSTLEEPDVDEDQACCDDEKPHQYRTEIEHMLAFRDEPKVVHVHIHIASPKFCQHACIARQEVGNRHTKTT